MNNREALIEALNELEDGELVPLMCRFIECNNCPASANCAAGGFNQVKKWMKKEGMTVEQFKDAFE